MRSLLANEVGRVASEKGPWFLVRNEGMRALYIPFKGLHRALTPSFPTKDQPEKGDSK